MKKSTLFFIGLLGLTFSISAQTIVYTGAGNKHAIVEEFTGIKCSNCPSGHTTLNGIITSNPGVVHTIGYNPTNSSYTDPTGTQGTDFRRSYLDPFYNSTYCSPGNGSRFMPSAFINRKILTSGNLLQSSSAWSGHVTNTLNETSPLNVGVKSVYNSTAQTLTIDVEVYYTSNVTAVNSLYVMISEDDLTSGYQSGSSATPSNPYIYKHTFRENVNTGQWGDAISSPTTQGSLYTKQYVFNLANAINPINIAKAHVLAFVIDANSSNKEVYTGMSVDADGGQGSTGTQVTGLNEISKNTDFNIYPNPSEGDNINIQLNNIADFSKLQVVNVLGELVYSENLSKKANQLVKLESTIFKSKGVYFIKVSSTENTTTKKLIIR